MLFEEDGVELVFSPDALRSIAAKAKEAGTGARALRMIVENLLLDLMYHVPSDPTVKQVIIDENCVTKTGSPTIIRS